MKFGYCEVFATSSSREIKTVSILVSRLRNMLNRTKIIQFKGIQEMVVTIPYELAVNKRKRELLTTYKAI